ncbi:hypothetical protein FHS78_002234 [Parvibaculum indicum]|nr:hypothetical protein [Parvibaculum indicum]
MSDTANIAARPDPVRVREYTHDRRHALTLLCR